MHPLQSAYDFYSEKLKPMLKEVVATKKILNELAREIGIDTPYPDVDSETGVVGGASITVKIDDFVNKPPSTALQEYLTKRGKEHGAIVWDTIVDVFKRGGFDFSKYGGEKAVRMTLIKNTTAFKFIRKQNAFGLKSWYGSDLKTKKKDSEAEKENDAKDEVAASEKK